jgi:lysophospholipase L1-like esterase
MASMAQDADYAIVEGGVNDASLGIALGAISDGYDATLDDTTFYGAFESMLKTLITRFAGKKYGYIIVHQMTMNYRVVNDPATSYYWAAKKCCEKWGVPYLDLNIAVPPFGMFNHSPTWELRTAYTLNNDGWHPNLEGYKKYYVPKIAAWMETL